MTDPTPIGVAFMQGTRYQHLGPSGQQAGLPQPSLELPADAALERIALPPAGEAVLVQDELRALIEERRSLREYAAEPLALAELSYLLWCTQGVQKAGRGATLRTVPSAGARHAFETHLLLNRIHGLAPGLYHFLASEHHGKASRFLARMISPRLPISRQITWR